MGSALFWSGQAMCLSKSNPDDVLRFAECLIIEKQYHRAAHLLKSHSLESTNIRGCYLAVKAAYESKELEDAVVIMEKADNMIKTERQKLPEYSINGNMNTPSVSITPVSANQSQKFQKEKVLFSGNANTDDDKLSDPDKLAHLRRSLGAIFLLRGRIYESLDNRTLAADAFKEAVQIDVFCHEAFEALIKHQILTLHLSSKNNHEHSNTAPNTLHLCTWECLLCVFKYLMGIWEVSSIILRKHQF